MTPSLLLSDTRYFWRVLQINASAGHLAIDFTWCIQPSRFPFQEGNGVYNISVTT
jgi:hypothetical protein